MKLEWIPIESLLFEHLFDRWGMASGTALSAQQIADLRAALVSGGLPDDPAELDSLISEIELLKSTGSAVQAEATVAYDAARRSAEAAQGVSARRQGRGVAAEIALARKESPHRGQVLLGFAKTAVGELPLLLGRTALQRPGDVAADDPVDSGNVRLCLWVIVAVCGFSLLANVA